MRALAEEAHPIAEFLPNLLLTIFLGMGMVYGALLAIHPAVDTNARA